MEPDAQVTDYPPVSSQHTIGRRVPLSVVDRIDSVALAVRRAEALIWRQPSAPHSVDSLARTVGVSSRSLYRGFERLRGYSPMAALRRARLLSARRDLLTATPDTHVTDVAMRWGFFHLGRFSGLYLARFGELPSATLRRSRGAEMAR